MINRASLTFPVQSPALRRYCAGELEQCPQCGGGLDTGWECTECGYDARDEAYPPEQRARDKALQKRGLL